MLNRTQRAILGVAALLIAALTTFPPWCFSGQIGTTRLEAAQGFAPIWESNGALCVDLKRFCLIQSGIVLVATAGILAFSSRRAEQQLHSRGGSSGADIGAVARSSLPEDPRPASREPSALAREVRFWLLIALLLGFPAVGFLFSAGVIPFEVAGLACGVFGLAILVQSLVLLVIEMRKGVSGALGRFYVYGLFSAAFVGLGVLGAMKLLGR